ncbi:MAG: hypothetical protein ACLRRT_10520 [Ruthenibacterium lactatiformans]
MTIARALAKQPDILVWMIRLGSGLRHRCGAAPRCGRRRKI